MGEVLEFEAGREADSPDRLNDIREVLNWKCLWSCRPRPGVGLLG